MSHISIINAQLRKTEQNTCFTTYKSAVFYETAIYPYYSREKSVYKFACIKEKS